MEMYSLVTSFFYKVGNVYDNPIKNIWYDSKELKFIKSIRNTDLKGCISCNTVANVIDVRNGIFESSRCFFVR